jgi:hypothetical protein
MTLRTIGALALHPTSNAQGTWYFMSLSMGRVLKRNHAMNLPMPHEIIDSVHRMARRQKANPGLVFADRNNILDPMDDSYDSNDDFVNESSEDDDDWSQPSFEDETVSGIDEPHDDGNDPSIDDNLDNPGDDETNDDFDADADDDSDIMPALEEPGVGDDDATDLAPIAEEPGVGDEDSADASTASSDNVDQDTGPIEDQGVDDATEQDVNATGADADDMDVRYRWRMENS